MTPNAPATLKVEAGVKKTEAEAQTGAKNRAKVSVRRIVAQAAVTSSEETFEIKSGSTTIATLGSFQWDVMQFEKTSFITPQPVDATADPAQDAMKVEYCKSPSFDFITTAGNFKATGADNAGEKYVYRAFTGTDVVKFTRNTDNKVNVTNIVKNPMKFITETTHQFGGKLEDTAATDKTGYRKGNTTYVIVSAKITPATDAWATGEEAKTGDDIYLGLKDNKFYKDLAAATTANKPTAPATLETGKDNVVKYTGGLCYYVAWLNPNNQGTGESKEPIVSPVLRNNIYHVNITGMKRIGYSGNPFNPGTDNPKDPDDPTPDPKETLYPIDTYMAIEVMVVNWGVHSYDHEF